MGEIDSRKNSHARTRIYMDASFHLSALVNPFTGGGLRVILLESRVTSFDIIYDKQVEHFLKLIEFRGRWGAT